MGNQLEQVLVTLPLHQTVAVMAAIDAGASLRGNETGFALFDVPKELERSLVDAGFTRQTLLYGEQVWMLIPKVDIPLLTPDEILMIRKRLGI